MAPPARALRRSAGPAHGRREWGEVYIDGRKTGITPPLKEIKLPPGKHTIEVRNASFPPYQQTVDLRTDSSVRIKHKFE